MKDIKVQHRAAVREFNRLCRIPERTNEVAEKIHAAGDEALKLHRKIWDY
jgi:hypothetical protein